MKWIGQHIWDFISRFRQEVYLEEVNNPGTDTDKFLVVSSSDGKVGYRTGSNVLSDIGAASSASDITGVTAGDGLTGGGASGGVTLAVGAGTGIDVAADTISVDVSDFMTNGVDNRIVTATGADGMNAEAKFTFDGTDLLLDSTGSLGTYGSNVLHLKNSNASIGGPGIRFQKIGKTGADADLIGQINFQALNDADELTTFAQVQAKIGDASDGAETGQLILGANTTLVGNVTGNASGSSGSCTGNAATSTTATNVVVTDDENTNVDHAITFVNDLDGSTSVGLESDGDFHYNPSTGGVTATLFSGALTGNADTATNLTTGDKTLAGIITAKAYVVEGNRNITPSGNGVGLHLDTNDYTDTSTSASGTASLFNYATIENPRLLATNSSVTTTTASTVFIKGAPLASTNQTISKAYALYVNDGDAYFGANIIAGNNRIKDDDGVTCITFDSSGNTTIANTLNATLTGNVTGNASGSSGSCTGQAATVATIAGLAPNTATTAAAQPNITSLHSSIAITKQVKVTLSTADCNALHTTPIELVAAQGADTVIVPTGGMIRVDRALTQGQSSADVNFHYADKEPGTTGQSSVAHYRRFMYNESGDRVFHISPAFFYQEVSQNLTDDVNKALEVSVDSAFTNNCFTSIDIYLTYNVFDIS